MSSEGRATLCPNPGGRVGVPATVPGGSPVAGYINGSWPDAPGTCKAEEPASSKALVGPQLASKCSVSFLLKLISRNSPGCREEILIGERGDGHREEVKQVTGTRKHLWDDCRLPVSCGC